MAKFLNTFGLVLGMIGVVIIFIWGPPQPSFPTSVGISVQPATRFTDGTTAQEMVDKAERERVFYSRMSRLGLGLIFLGFGLQTIAVWVPDGKPAP